MDIAQLSSSMSQFSIGTQVGIALTSMQMDMVKQNGAQLDSMLKQMELSVNPHIGGNIDVRI
ncbi:hypothetical protein AN642_01305 [Epulopiscium sp. SCG-B10WGA-EpuloA2]|nr:hypothetical protein AN642_01305 [Epulopiscium sp. SCG-B10WGA-EpuloA2]